MTSRYTLAHVGTPERRTYKTVAIYILSRHIHIYIFNTFILTLCFSYRLESAETAATVIIFRQTFSQ